MKKPFLALNQTLSPYNMLEEAEMLHGLKKIGSVTKKKRAKEMDMMPRKEERQGKYVSYSFLSANVA